MDFDNILPTEMTPEQAKAWGAHVVGLLEDGSPGSQKQAEMSMNDYIRPYNREMDFCNRIIEPTPWDESERVPALDHDHPMLYVEIEPASPGAMLIDYGYLPNTFYPYGQRMPMVIQQHMTDRVVKEVTELGAYRYRFRTAITDLMSLQLAARRDERFMNAVRALLGTANTNLPYTGKPNNTTVAAALTYDGWLKFLDILVEQPNKLETATVLVNTLTLRFIRKMLVAAFAGTELAADVWRKAWSEFYFEGNNVKLIATIKDALISKSEYIGFAAQGRLGRYVQYYEPTMVVKNEGLHISFYEYEALAMTIVNPAAVSRTTFTDT